MSEFDSLSDSDWLDIASSRESDDNDSITSAGDSDRDDIGSFSHSRRSSISIGSSREGEVEAWEGFVDDSGDEAAVIENGGFVECSETMPQQFIPDVEQDSEDQQVKDGLDQSLVGTLSASRSSTAGSQGSPQTSIRDLRLSFPDPLTSSRNELNRSYDDVSPSETTTDVDEVIAPIAPHQAVLGQDPGLHPLTPAVRRHEAQFWGDMKTGLDVVLYGSSTSIKWSFVQDLVDKASAVSGQTLASTLESVNGPTQFLQLNTSTSSEISSIFVFDYTRDSLIHKDAVR